jgi:Spy/CpxP family protein refolding chaperone
MISVSYIAEVPDWEPQPLHERLSAMMKPIAFLALGIVAAALGGCAREIAAPEDQSPLSSAAASDAAGGLDRPGHPGLALVPGLNRLPDNLKLTADQLAKIAQLTARFQAATKEDAGVVRAVAVAVAEAIKAGKSRADIRQIMERGAAAAERLATANRGYHSALLEILTREQRAWLEANRPKVCTAPPLTDAQKATIRQLTERFTAANKADLDKLAEVGRQLATARRDGKSPAEVQALLESVRPIRERVRAASEKLHAAIQAVLTPEQQASRCFRFRRPGSPGHMLPSLARRAGMHPGRHALRDEVGMRRGRMNGTPARAHVLR